MGAATQTFFEKRPFDKTRLAVFAVFGCLYLGCWQYYYVNFLFQRIFPKSTLAHTLGKICLANFAMDPFVYFPTFYVMREVLITRTASADTVLCPDPNDYVAISCLPLTEDKPVEDIEKSIA